MNLIIGLALFFQTAHALPIKSWQNASVKISSYPCLTEAPRFEGSGLIFKKGQDLYVLTSEHVVIHDHSSNTCHEADGQQLTLVRSDFYSGLALLKVADKNSALGARAINEADLIAPRDISTLLALGFPSGTDQLSTLKNGEALSVTSHRALIAGVDQMIEASGLPVEYGMSGGTLLSLKDEDADWAGLLSHQILRREGGKPTAAEELEPGTTAQNDLALAIPADTILNWLKSTFADGNPIDWHRNVTAQIDGSTAIQFGSLVFSMHRRKAGDVWDVGGLVFGGSDGSGIGGGDSDTDDDGNELLSVINVNFVDGANSTERAQVFTDPELEAWRLWLLSGKKVLIPFLKTPDTLRLGRIKSLAQFLTLWKRDGYLPLALRSKDPTGHTENDILQERSSRVAQLAQHLKDRSQTTEQKAWFAMIRDLAISSQSALAGSEQIAGLLAGANQRYWNEFYVEDFDRAVELESSLIALKEQLVKMGL